MTVINVTKSRKEREYYPCDDCIVGWGSLSQWTDPETGDLMQESKSCHEDCEKLKLWQQDKHQFLLNESLQKHGQIFKAMV